MTRAEFGALVRSKAFLVSVLLLPVVIIGMSTLQVRLAGRVDGRPRRFAVIDPSGCLYPQLEALANARNTRLKGRASPFQPEPVTGPITDELRWRLSERVRREELFAFVELDGGALDAARPTLRYHADNVGYTELWSWLSDALEDLHRRHLYEDLKLAPDAQARLETRVEVSQLGLYARDAEGQVRPAEKLDPVKALLLPLIPPFLLFFFIAVSSPQLMNSVLVEKMSRVSEVMLGSVRPFELMMGKLLGSVGVSLLLGILYVATGVTVARRMGLGVALPLPLVAWFLVFLVLAMLLYGSICIAVGAACNDLKDAQNLMLPVMLPLVVPLLLAKTIIEAPNGPMAVGLSLFPPATPMILLLRIGLQPHLPGWQIALGVLGTLTTSIVCVWAAGRIFRIGILSQGRSATLAEMLRWVRGRY